MTNAIAYQLNTVNYADVISMMYRALLQTPIGITIYLPQTVVQEEDIWQIHFEIEPLPYDIEQGLLNSPQHHRMTALLRKKFAHV